MAAEWEARMDGASMNGAAQDATAHPPVAGYRARLRFGRRLATLVLCLLIAVPPHLLYRFFVRRPRGVMSPIVPWFLRMGTRAMGARVKVEGTPMRHHALILSNHLSWLDILALGGVSGCAFVSKDDVAKWPVVGWLARQNNTIFVARSQRGKVGDQLAALREALTRDQPVAIFPEGTTGDGVELGAFKSALLAVLDQPPRALHVQPVVIDYGDAQGDVAWPHGEGAKANFIRILSRPGTITATIRYLPSFDPGAHSHRKEIAAEARRRILAAQAG